MTSLAMLELQPTRVRNSYEVSDRQDKITSGARQFGRVVEDEDAADKGSKLLVS